MNRSSFVVIVIGILIVAIMSIFRYQPAVVAAQGYVSIHVNQPSFVQGYSKVVENFVDYTRCDMELLGWDTENNLYYDEVCNNRKKVWKFNPYIDNTPKNVESIPTALLRQEVSSLEIVEGASVRPRTVEKITRPLLMKQPGLRSPDATWIAIISKHIYGPMDVLVIRQL